MDMTPSVVRISERSAVGEFRRRALELARSAGFGEEAAGRVAIVATELAGNVAKHGLSGHCFLSLSEEAGESLVQIVAVDDGPGIDDPARALHDGYSAVGTAGTGLGAVRRLSRGFDLFSRSGEGTVVVGRVAPDRSAGGGERRTRTPIEVGAVASPGYGELVNGDACALEREGAAASLLVADGLGHGPLAAEASHAAVATFERLAGRSPAQRVNLIHEALRGTRGAAIAVASIEPGTRSVRYAGIGNISAQIIAGTRVQRLVSMNGTAGQQARTIREFSYDFPPGALLVMHSDGVSGRWSLDPYPGITLRDPALIAALIHRDHIRGRDDATVVVARNDSKPAGSGDSQPS